MDIHKIADRCDERRSNEDSKQKPSKLPQCIRTDNMMTQPLVTRNVTKKHMSLNRHVEAASKTHTRIHAKANVDNVGKKTSVKHGLDGLHRWLESERERIASPGEINTRTE